MGRLPAWARFAGFGGFFGSFGAFNGQHRASPETSLSAAKPSQGPCRVSLLRRCTGANAISDISVPLVATGQHAIPITTSCVSSFMP
jgi:hypothetical protein